MHTYYLYSDKTATLLKVLMVIIGHFLMRIHGNEMDIPRWIVLAGNPLDLQELPCCSL